MSEDGTERSVSWEYSPVVRQHIHDANRADDYPADLTFQVKKEAVIASGSLETIRWLYDYLHYLKRAWRHEGEQWDADAAEEMAVSLYEQVDGELPDRQRTKELMTDGGTNTAGTDRSDREHEMASHKEGIRTARKFLNDADETEIEALTLGVRYSENHRETVVSSKRSSPQSSDLFDLFADQVVYLAEKHESHPAGILRHLIHVVQDRDDTPDATKSDDVDQSVDTGNERAEGGEER